MQGIDDPRLPLTDFPAIPAGARQRAIYFRLVNAAEAMSIAIHDGERSSFQPSVLRIMRDGRAAVMAAMRDLTRLPP